MAVYRILQDDELMHYGVRGMKWGKRKAKVNYKTEMSYILRNKTAAKELENNARKGLSYENKRRIELNKATKGKNGAPFKSNTRDLIERRKSENIVNKRKNQAKQMQKKQTLLINKRYKTKSKTRRQTK